MNRPESAAAAAPAAMTDAERIARVKHVVLAASDDVRRRYPFLRHQDAIGATIMAVSLLGMIGRRLGMSVLLLERGTHPRFAIGESTSPLANLLLEEIARMHHEVCDLLPAARWYSETSRALDGPPE